MTSYRQTQSKPWLELRQQRGIEIDHHTIDGANHFFHEKLEELEQTVGQYLDQSMVEHAKQAVIG